MVTGLCPAAGGLSVQEVCVKQLKFHTHKTAEPGTDPRNADFLRAKQEDEVLYVVPNMKDES